MGWVIAVGCFIFILAIIVIAVRNDVANDLAKEQKLFGMSPSERERYVTEQKEKELTDEWGSINPAMVCPHCQSKGKIRTKRVVQKKGISGGKATAALITGGVSILATGLSRKEETTKAFCGNCNNTWLF